MPESREHSAHSRARLKATKAEVGGGIGRTEMQLQLIAKALDIRREKQFPPLIGDMHTSVLQWVCS